MLSDARRRVSWLDGILDRYTKILEAFIAVCLVLMVMLVFGNVVLRYGFNSGISVSEEISRWLFVWLTFMGAVANSVVGGRLGWLMGAGGVKPLKADAVAEAVIEAVSDEQIKGVVDVPEIEALANREWRRGML